MRKYFFKPGMLNALLVLGKTLIGQPSKRHHGLADDNPFLVL